MFSLSFFSGGDAVAVIRPGCGVYQLNQQKNLLEVLK